jgi:hypothetical protein
MPQPVLHVVLANRTIAHWRRTRSNPPFRVDDAAAVNAFRHGSLGPDMGLFPWSEKLISQLAHTNRTGVVARELVNAASTEIQRAFGWGWVSHVIADAAIHPLVNDAAERFDADSAVADAELLVRHVTVEVGLDAFYARRTPDLLKVPLRSAFGPRDLDYLRGSLLRTYGVEFDRPALDATHRNVTRFYRLYLVLQRMIATEQTNLVAATQYALLSSFMSFSRDIGSSPSGYIAAATGWPAFFLLSILFAIPGLLLIRWLDEPAAVAASDAPGAG